MKNSGAILIEVLVSMALFFVLIFPLINFNFRLISINNNIITYQHEYKNFKSLGKFLKSRGNQYLQNYLGEYNESDEFIANIELPYKRSKSTRIKVKIQKMSICSENERYKYIYIKIIYTYINNKFTSEHLVSRF